jgi:hypothetical protein
MEFEMNFRISTTRRFPYLLLGLLIVICGSGAGTVAQKVRLRSHVDPPCTIAGSNPAVWKFSDIGGDGNIAVQGSTSCTGVFIYDMTNPDNIVLASHFDPSPGVLHFTEAVVKGNRGYFGTGAFASSMGVMIVDLTDPYHPVLLGSVTPTVGNGFPAVHEMEVWGNYLVEVNQSGFNKIVKFINVSNPASPVFIRDLVTSEAGYVHATHIRGNRLFISGFGSVSTRGKTYIYDVSNIETQAPALLAEFEDIIDSTITNDQQIHSSWSTEDGNYLYVVREQYTTATRTSGELRVYDIHDPTHPVRVNKIVAADLGLNASSPHNPVVVGNRLYVSWYEAGLQVFDISDPVHPVRIGQYDSFPEPYMRPGGIVNRPARGFEPGDVICGFSARSAVSNGYQGDWAVYPFLGDDRILLGDMNSGMYVIDVTKIDSPLKNQVSDFDGDGKTDISVYRPGPGDWHVMSSMTGATTSTQFGLSGDQVVAGDYDGDGKSDLAVFRPSEGNWYILGSAAGFTGLHFGLNGDVPVAADYDADGRTDVAVWRPSEGVWYILRSTLGFTAYQWGMSGDKAFSGDYEGDGKADYMIYRPSNGYWYLLPSSSGIAQYIPFGLSNVDKPVSGDFDGDGKWDQAVYRPTTGEWYIRNSTNGALIAYRFGLAEDIPVPGDYDGDSKADVAVFRPSDRTWYRLNSSNGAFAAEIYGLTGDMPSPASVNP